jgi:hypothetical protein
LGADVDFAEKKLAMSLCPLRGDAFKPFLFLPAMMVLVLVQYHCSSSSVDKEEKKGKKTKKDITFTLCLGGW